MNGKMKTTFKYFGKIYPVLILFMLNIASCRINSYTNTSVEITNVKEKQSFTISANPKHKHVWSVHLKITGELNGKAVIYTGYQNDKSSYKFEIPSGKIDMEKHSDWYATDCIITFEPVDCSNGNLKIEYSFGSD